MAEADGRKRLERMTHLLGTDHFNEPSTPAVKQDTVVTPLSPTVQLATGPVATGVQEASVQAPVPDLKVEGRQAEPAPKVETSPAEALSTPPSKGGKRSPKTPPPEEPPAPPLESAPSPPSTDASGPRLKATKIVDDQFHIEHIYENPEGTPPKRGKRQSSPPPAPPSTGAATPEVAMPVVGEDMESVVTEIPPSGPAPVDVKPEENPLSAPAHVSTPVNSLTPTMATPHLNHGGGENHPKVPWSVKVPLDMYDFIRDHDNYRPFLKDQRPFREKFLEWVMTVRSDVSQQLDVARDAAVKARERQTTGPVQSGKVAESVKGETL